MLSLIDIINEQQHTHYRMISKFENGVQGAFMIEDDTGKAFVLKWADTPALTARIGEALRYTELLHSQGYPLPRYVHTGDALGGQYSVQEKLPGTLCNPTQLPKLLSSILELNELQRGKAAPAAIGLSQSYRPCSTAGPIFVRMNRSSSTPQLRPSY